MRALTHKILFLFRFVVLGLIVALLINFFWPHSSLTLRNWLGLDKNTPTQKAAVPEFISNLTSMRPAPSSYAHAVDKAAPAVVNIYAHKIVDNEESTSPFPYFFDDHPAPMQQNRQEQSLGSGVIMNDKGYILTNRHVIDDAEDVQVLTQKGIVSDATVIGTDKVTDLAVLKIGADDDLQAIQLDTHHASVGDVVLAIGNPLGIGQTVTMGIISAMDRQLDPSNPETFIQTDAAINFGNSGGALVNTQGKLVGINTALVGRAQGAEGISFAIPAATARHVMHAIIEHGHVIRGWLGVSYTYLNPGSVGDHKEPSHGVLITSVYPNSPAQTAGLRQGDVITDIDGSKISDPIHFYQLITTALPEQKMKVNGYRNGKSFSRDITLLERPHTVINAHP